MLATRFVELCCDTEAIALLGIPNNPVKIQTQYYREYVYVTISLCWTNLPSENDCHC